MGKSGGEQCGAAVVAWSSGRAERPLLRRAARSTGMRGLAGLGSGEQAAAGLDEGGLARAASANQGTDGNGSEIV